MCNTVAANPDSVYMRCDYGDVAPVLFNGAGWWLIIIQVLLSNSKPVGWCFMSLWRSLMGEYEMVCRCRFIACSLHEWFAR